MGNVIIPARGVNRRLAAVARPFRLISTPAARCVSTEDVMPSDRPPFFGLLQRRTCLCPTWRGWLMAALIVVPLVVAGLRGLQPFLALNRPAPGGVLVIEGWLPDFAMEAALAEARRTPYAAIYVTGGPLEQGKPLSVYKTFAELGAATLEKLGPATPAPIAVPAGDVRRDRTYASAVTLREWLKAHGGAPAKLNLVSIGAHARRSRMMFAKAFGPGTEVGVIAVAGRDYDSRHWWRTSQGFRTVTDEFIAYLYATFVFTAE